MTDAADAGRCGRANLVAIAFAALAFSGFAVAQDSGLARCRAIADNAARLACYDALPLEPATRASPSVGGEVLAPLVIPADQFSPEVTITRGLLSAFYFNVKGDNRTVRVKRVQ